MSDYCSRGVWLKRWTQPEKADSLSIIHEKIISRYREPHRYYHDLDHIEACLEEFHEVEHLLTHPFEVWLAIWFHDIVYITRGKDNEEASVEYTRKSLGGLLVEGSIDLVSRLILVTKHDSPALSKDEEFIMDIDLAILGKDVQTFDEYEKAIRKEYHWVPEAHFSKGRTDILMGFIERESIYQSGFFKEKYEEKARENLRRSIKRLKKGG